MFFNISAAAIIKNEAGNLPEWIEYHRLIGVEHFFIFDNNSSDDLHSVVARYINHGLVTLIYWPFIPGQLPAYSFATKVLGHTSKWMALIDLDEFIFLPAGNSLGNFLAEFEDVDQIVIPYMFFGSSGHTVRPTGLTIENYVHRAEAVDNVVKSIVRPSAVSNADTHMCLTRNRRTVNEKGHRVPERWRVDNPSGERIRINHYYIKSLQDWTEKLSRGEVDPNRTKKLEMFERMDFRISDTSMISFVEPIKACLNAARQTPLCPQGYGVSSSLSEITYMRPWLVKAHEFVNALKESLCSNLTIDPLKTSLDRNIDRAILHVQLTASDIMLKKTGAALAFGLDSMAKEFEAELIALDRLSLSAPMVGTAKIVEEAIYYSPEEGLVACSVELRSKLLGRHYHAFYINVSRDCTYRIQLTGFDAAGNDFKYFRFIKLYTGLNAGVVTISNRSFTASRLTFHFTEAEIVEILDQRVYVFI